MASSQILRSDWKLMRGDGSVLSDSPRHRRSRATSLQDCRPPQCSRRLAWAREGSGRPGKIELRCNVEAAVEG
eukprot:746271-Hanusia_phi.AAC.1